MYGSNLKDHHHSPKYPNVSLSLFLAIKSRDCYLHVWQYLFGHMSQPGKSHIYIISALYTWAFAWQPSSLAEWLATSMSMLRLFFRVRWFALPKLLCHFNWFGLGCDWWPDGQKFNYIQCRCDLRHGLKFGWPWETEGEASKAWSGNVGEKKLSSHKGRVRSVLGSDYSLVATHNWREEGGLNITTIS